MSERGFSTNANACTAIGGIGQIGISSERRDLGGTREGRALGDTNTSVHDGKEVVSWYSVQSVGTLWRSGCYTGLLFIGFHCILGSYAAQPEIGICPKGHAILDLQSCIGTSDGRQPRLSFSFHPSIIIIIPPLVNTRQHWPF